jgi:hypothetical protein
MKNLILILTASIVITACNREVKFGQQLNNSEGRSVQNPAPPDCVAISDINITAPTRVQTQETFSLTVNRPNATWRITKDATTTELVGSSIQTSLLQPGNYNGELVTSNNCDDVETNLFSIQVIDPVSGVGLVINNNDVYTNDSSVNLTLSANNADEVYVTNSPNCLDGGAWEPFASNKNWTLSQTNSSARVFAKFRNSLVETNCISDDIIHDNVAPVIQFVSTPPNVTSSREADFEITAVDSVSGIKTIQCRLDSSAYQTCQLEMSFTGLNDGSHTLTYVAEDLAGNTSQPLTYTWTVDDSAPSVTITRAPTSPTTDSNATFEFSVTSNYAAVTSIVCSLNGSTAVPCQSPITYNGLSIGIQNFTVTATNSNNKTGSDSHQWEIQNAQVIQDIIISSGGGKADVLFVMDNSFSMYSLLRESISTRFDRFISELNHVDFQIAVTTGSATGNREFESGRLTRILRSAVPGPGIALVPSQYLIHPLMSNAQRNFMATIQRPEAICIQVGTHMCPQSGRAYQESLHSSLKAIDRAENQSFFREDASLHIVIISGKDEGNGNLTDRSGNVYLDAPDYNRPETLINRVNEKWQEKEFKVHTVVRGPESTNCNGFYVDNSVQKAFMHSKATELTGGYRANICNSLNRSEISTLARSISGGQNSYELNCDPKDTTGDGTPDVLATYNPNPSTPIQITTVGRTISFSPNPPVGTSVRLTYECL